MVVDMFAVNRAGAPRKVGAAAPARGARSLPRLRSDGERGAALVEFALVLPILMTLVMGLLMSGIFINQYLELTNAVAIGGQVLAVDRGNTTDPCLDAVTAIQNTAPLLTPSNIKFSFTLNGVSFPSSGTYAGGGSSYCTGGAADLIQNANVEIIATYPCSLQIFNNANILPGCTLTAEITDVSQ
jgi:hypothetical protein